MLPSDPLVIFVCHGNIYRSPFAAALFASEQRRRGRSTRQARSAGMLESGGSAAPEDAQLAAKDFDIALADHTSRALDESSVAEADLLVVMDARNEAMLLSRFPNTTGKLVRLGAFDPETPADGSAISDPYGKGPDAVQECYRRIARAVAGLTRALGTHSLIRAGAPTPQIKRLARSLLTSPGVSNLWSLLTRDAATIFMMHRFADESLGVPGHDPAQLARNLEYLRKERFNIISLGDLVNQLASGAPLPAKTVCFTVDDGYADFANVGAPVLAQYDVPATLFLVTGLVDGRVWPWHEALRYLVATEPRGELLVPIGDNTFPLRWATIEERDSQTTALIRHCTHLPTPIVLRTIDDLCRLTGRELPRTPEGRYTAMSWEQVRSWGARGISFGPHTDSHPVLSRTAPAEAAREIQFSWERVRAEVAQHVPVFCYPFGMAEDFSSGDGDAIASAGLEAAVTAIGGYCRSRNFRESRFRLPRVSYEDDPHRFRQVVSGLERAKRILRGQD